MADCLHILDKEVWKVVPSYEGLYEVSSHGRVRRVARHVAVVNRWGTYTTRYLPEQILRPIRAGSGGYLSVGLWKSGQSRLTRVNIIACETFNGPAPPHKPLALHKDGDKQHNCADNLRWGDNFDNAADRSDHGRTARGEQQHSARLTEADVRRIRERASSGERVAAIARDYPLNPSCIYAVVNRETWRHVL